MHSEESKYLLEKLLQDFDPKKVKSNNEYLDTQLTYLNRMVYVYREQSTNPDLDYRNRALARDREQNCLGLINGIKFAISFLECSNVDLMQATKPQ